MASKEPTTADIATMHHPMWFAGHLTRAHHIEAFERSMIGTWFYGEVPMTLTFVGTCSWLLLFEDAAELELRSRLRHGVNALWKQHPRRGALASGTGRPPPWALPAPAVEPKSTACRADAASCRPGALSAADFRAVSIVAHSPARDANGRISAEIELIYEPA
jgi:hypothetical protein